VNHEKQFRSFLSKVLLAATVAAALNCFTAVSAAKNITLNLTCVVVFKGSFCDGRQSVTSSTPVEPPEAKPVQAGPPSAAPPAQKRVAGPPRPATRHPGKPKACPKPGRRH